MLVNTKMKHRTLARALVIDGRAWFILVLLDSGQNWLGEYRRVEEVFACIEEGFVPFMNFCDLEV